MGTEVYLVGKKAVDYTDRKTGEQITGYTLYFFCKTPDVDGHYADKVWIDARRQSQLYAEVAKLYIGDDFLPVEFVYSIIPGRRSQQLVAINLIDMKG